MNSIPNHPPHSPRPLTLLLASLLGFGTGCATSPVSKPLRQAAKTSPTATLPNVLSDPGGYSGRTVVWGGTLLRTVNETNASLLYILERPLTSTDEPRADVMSRGRFIAASSRFLDPKEFSEGKTVTVAGEITSSRTEQLDQTTYTYPVVSAREVYLWQPPPAYIESPFYYPPPYPYYYGWPYYYPAWGTGVYYHRHSKYKAHP